MKLKKALEIVNHYAYVMQNDNFRELADINDNELEELEEAYQEISEFLCQFK